MKFLCFNLLLIYHLVENICSIFFCSLFVFDFFYYWWKFIYFGYKFFVIYTNVWFLNIFITYYGNISLYMRSYCLILGGGGLVTKSCTTLGTPWTVACQAPLSMRFSRQEYWSGLPFASPGIFLTQESNPGLLNCRQILYRLSYKGSPPYARLI